MDTESVKSEHSGRSRRSRNQNASSGTGPGAGGLAGSVVGGNSGGGGSFSSTPTIGGGSHHHRDRDRTRHSHRSNKSKRGGDMAPFQTSVNLTGMRFACAWMSAGAIEPCKCQFRCIVFWRLLIIRHDLNISTRTKA